LVPDDGCYKPKHVAYNSAINILLNKLSSVNITKINQGLFNRTEFYLLYRTTCFDPSEVILTFTVGL